MLSENIRRFRKARSLRQEELAERVHVVRQTVSKWENGLSVPDAEQLRDLAAVLGVSVSALLDLTPEDSEADLAGELARLMVFSGLISPRLPFNRHTGLRLPWTVADERAWRAAHETLGVISLPAALLYLACVLAFPDGETVTLRAVALWLGIPALRSYRVFRGK